MKPAGWVALIVVLVALGWTYRLYANALATADVAAAASVVLVAERDAVADLNEDLTDELAAADTAAAARARADSTAIAELDRENQELEGTIRDLSAQDAVNEESVDVALRDLGAVLNPEAVPALRAYTMAWQTRLVGLQDIILIDDSVKANLRTEIALVEGQLVTERTNRSAADVLTAGLRVQIVTMEELDVERVIEIDALRLAVAPSFFQKIFQNIGLIGGTAAVTTLVVVALTR